LSSPTAESTPPAQLGLMSRMSLARAAARAVLDTLTEADYAGAGISI